MENYCMLTHDQLDDIFTLQALCETHDGITIKLNGDMLRRESYESYDLLSYDNGRLTGFLGVYPFGSTIELCGMVHPDFRRRGIFQSLFNRALKEISKNTVDKVLANSHGRSPAGKAFIEANGGLFDNTEFEMEWVPCELPEPDGSVQLRGATREDTPEMKRLGLECFGIEDASFDEAHIDDTLMILFDGEVAGQMKISRDGGQCYIYWFSVFPALQGRGIGRRALSRVVRETEGKYSVIGLDVAAKNEHALKLYTSLGFVVQSHQDYYSLSL